MIKGWEGILLINPQGKEWALAYEVYFSSKSSLFRCLLPFFFLVLDEHYIINMILILPLLLFLGVIIYFLPIDGQSLFCPSHSLSSTSCLWNKPVEKGFFSQGATIGLPPCLTLTLESLIAGTAIGVCCGVKNGYSGFPPCPGKKNAFPDPPVWPEKLKRGGGMGPPSGKSLCITPLGKRRGVREPPYLPFAVSISPDSTAPKYSLSMAWSAVLPFFSGTAPTPYPVRPGAFPGFVSCNLPRTCSKAFRLTS